MSLEENKKGLFIVGMEQELNYDYILQRYDLQPEEIIVIESDEVERIQPFGDLMRDILIQVYDKNIDEIFIVKNQEENSRNITISSGMEQTIDQRNNITTVNYLFDHCQPEFPNRTLQEWLLGTEESIEEKPNPIEILRSHPLIPASINVNCGDESCVLM
ncbi:hypothetical protein [Niallia sp. Krafla_26]|uniref:hypothetical protein n=1 Tax=Niallia sp. Krafla_26 TaxID=3064703 RepID=UPI003D1721D7